MVNAISMKWFQDIRCKDDVFSHLYTLILNPDGSYEVLIDNEKAESGTLQEDWDFLPPKMIKDPEAKKPEDWDDRWVDKSGIRIWIQCFLLLRLNLYSVNNLNKLMSPSYSMMSS